MPNAKKTNKAVKGSAVAVSEFHAYSCIARSALNAAWDATTTKVKTELKRKPYLIKKSDGYASSVEIDDEISDPEVLAELEYAREHGQALSTADTTDAAKSILPRTRLILLSKVAGVFGTELFKLMASLNQVELPIYFCERLMASDYYSADSLFVKSATTSY
uniref:Uncharacterized protein n=1 Tax=Parascaris equorum TaxID=6256 RepID=A0A914SC87_PAREQ